MQKKRGPNISFSLLVSVGCAFFLVFFMLALFAGTKGLTFGEGLAAARGGFLVRAWKGVRRLSYSS